VLILTKTKRDKVCLLVLAILEALQLLGLKQHLQIAKSQWSVDHSLKPQTFNNVLLACIVVKQLFYTSELKDKKLFNFLDEYISGLMKNKFLFIYNAQYQVMFFTTLCLTETVSVLLVVQNY
jgi:hypothetical protein